MLVICILFFPWFRLAREAYCFLVFVCVCVFKDLFIHGRYREKVRQRHRQREKQAPCREPDVGLDPGSSGSHPRLQAAPNRCATGAALNVHS